MRKKRKKIFVNMISLTRIIGAALVPLFFAHIKVPIVILIVSLLFLTDMIDGMLARTWKVQTRGGALLDPLADKLLAISCILAFILKDIKLIAVLILELSITTLEKPILPIIILLSRPFIRLRTKKLFTPRPVIYIRSRGSDKSWTTSNPTSGDGRLSRIYVLKKN